MGTTGNTTVTAPDVSGVLDLDGTEQAFEAADTQPAPHGSLRGFRAMFTRGDAAPDDVPSVDDNKGQRAQAHTARGSADDRRGATTILPDEQFAAMPRSFDSVRHEVVITPEAPPARPRLGWTGEDNTRAAQYTRPILMRQFDKGIADHPQKVLKAEFDSPTAQASKQLGDIVGGQPFAGGSTGTQRAGIGPGRNSFRIMPKAWDTLLVDTGGPAVSPSNPDPSATAASMQAGPGRSFRR